MSRRDSGFHEGPVTPPRTPRRVGARRNRPPNTNFTRGARRLFARGAETLGAVMEVVEAAVAPEVVLAVDTGLAIVDAVTGMTGSSDPLSQTKQMGVINNQANRASMKKTGKVKLGAKKRSVKVPKKLRQQVKQVLRSKDYTGTYIVDQTQNCYFGCRAESASVVGYANLGPTVGPYPTIFTSTFVAKDLVGRVCVYWGAGRTSQTTPSSPLDFAPDIVNGNEWVFFTPAKILNAASILWNRKRKQLNYNDQNGNFDINVTRATGAIPSSTPATPGKSNFKLTVANSFVQMKIKNVSKRRMKLTFYNCTSKVAFPDRLPLDALVYAIVQDATTTTSEVWEGDLDPTGTPINPTLFHAQIATNPSFEPAMTPSFNSMYKYQKVEINIAPGETTAHSIQGPKNFELDFAKLNTGGVDKSGYFWKKCSVACLMKMELETDVGEMIHTFGDPYTFGPTNRPAQIASYTSAYPGITIEMKEVFKLKCPEISGFIQQVVAAGAPQALNLKKRSIAMLNFGPEFTITSEEFQNNYPPIYNEENPAAPITGFGR